MRYLSEDWLRALDEAAAPLGPSLPPDMPPITVQAVVTGGPDGDVHYHVVMDPPRLSVRPGRATAPTVTLTQRYDAAAEVAAGRRSAQAAFIAGDIRLGGDVTPLIEHREAFGVLDEAVQQIRAATEP